MLSSNILSAPNNKFWLRIILVAISTLAVIIPVLINHDQGIFFSIDPDVVYTTNALTYAKYHQIYYIDHPGTPSIMLLSLALWPIRIYAKLIAHQPFIYFVTAHISSLYFYLRLFQGFLFATALFLFLTAILKNTISVMSTFVGLLGIFCLSSLPYTGISIGPETFSFFIVALWLFAFNRFVRNRSPLVILLLSVLAGIAVANKFTNLFLLFATLGLVFSLDTLKLKQKLANVFVDFCTFVFTFLLFTWPVHNQYQNLFGWVSRLFTTSQVHTAGKKTIFDLHDYAISILTLTNLERLFIFLILLTLGLSLFILLKKYLKYTHPVFIVFFSALSGFFVFAKYPLSHYQLANFLMILYALTFLISKLKTSYKVLILGVLFLNLPINLERYYKILNTSIEESKNIEVYQLQHPSIYATVWDWAPTADFAQLWTRSWGNNINSSELSQIHPNLWELKTGYLSVSQNGTDKKGVFDTCWDQLYLPTSGVPIFKNLYQDKPLNYKQITRGTVLITSNHCSTKPEILRN